MGEIGLGEHLLGEMQGRYTGDLGEIQGRYMGEMGLGEHLRLDVLLDGDDVEVRSDQVVDEVDALVLGAARLGGAGRCRGDAGEVQGRYRGDAGEMQGRCRGDAGEMIKPRGTLLQVVCAVAALPDVEVAHVSLAVLRAWLRGGGRARGRARVPVRTSPNPNPNPSPSPKP